MRPTIDTVVTDCPRPYVWQQQEWNEIQHWRQQGRLPHALLLLGESGFGQYDFARCLAHTLLCPSEAMEPCCSCHACQLFHAGTHPDFFDLNKGSQDKGNISIEAIRSLISRMMVAPHLGLRQIAIIHPADKMTHAAVNAFLKILEEPAGDVFFILISHSRSPLLPTLTSRCQQLEWRLPRYDTKTNLWLQQHLQITERHANRLLTVTDGVPLTAVAFEGADYITLRKTLLLQWIGLIKREVDPLSWAHELMQTAPLAFVWRALFSIALDVLRLQLHANSQSIDDENHKELQQLYRLMSTRQLLHLLSQLEEGWRMMNSITSINTRLLIENMLLSMLEVIG